MAIWALTFFFVFSSIDCSGRTTTTVDFVGDYYVTYLLSE
jgi:hypothetical protein